MDLSSRTHRKRLEDLNPALQVKRSQSVSEVVNFGDFRLGEILAIRPLDEGLRPFDKEVTRKRVTHTTPREGDRIIGWLRPLVRGSQQKIEFENLQK